MNFNKKEAMMLKKLKVFLSKIKQYAKHPKAMEKDLFCKIFGYNKNEYVYYNFEKRSIIDRLSFVSFHKSREIIEKLNKKMTNKKENYLLMKDYYGRDVIIFDKDEPNGKELIASFIKKHNQVIVKGFDSSSGQNIKKYDAICDDSIFDKISRDFPNGCLIEEVIHQTKDLESLHSQSVNTLRITTVNYGNKTEAIYPVLRVGTGDDFIDNNKQGLLCAVDENSGMVLSAFDFCGKKYASHPDINEKLIGFVVPELNKAIFLSKKLATYYPENVFVGFDFAHTHNGWILVEANTNTNFTIWQLPYQKSFRKEVKKIKKEK